MKELNPTARFLMGAGPGDVHPCVLKALATNMIGHLDPQFLTVMDVIKEMLCQTLSIKFFNGK